MNLALSQRSGSGAAGGVITMPRMPTSVAPRRACQVVAAVSWFAIILVAILSATGQFADPPTIKGHLFGHHPDGLAGAASRLTDTFSYFTIWSGVVVAIAFTVMALRPEVTSTLHRVLLLDALLMITITTIVYWTMLAANDTWSGWSIFTSPLQHAVVGALAIGTWALLGPRGWLTMKLLPKALIIPLAWIAWTLLRGAVIDAYPYDFADVATLGYPRVAVTLVVILLIGLAIAAAYVALDRRLSRRAGDARPALDAS